MAVFRRRELILGATALGLVGVAGCNKGAAAGQTADDMVIGQANAPVSLLEYFSVTCPHCKEFHETVYEQLKHNYIDTGKVKMILREVPAPPQLAPVAVAGFQLARCGGANADQYMTRIGVLFAQQDAIFASGSMEGVRQKFIEVGAASGLSEQQVMACIEDEEGGRRIQRNIELASRTFGQEWGTPTLVLNGTRLTDTADYTYAGLSHRLDAAIAGH